MFITIKILQNDLNGQGDTIFKGGNLVKANAVKVLLITDLHKLGMHKLNIHHEL